MVGIVLIVLIVLIGVVGVVGVVDWTVCLTAGLDGRIAGLGYWVGSNGWTGRWNIRPVIRGTTLCLETHGVWHMN